MVNNQSANQLENRLKELRDQLQLLDPHLLAYRTCTSYHPSKNSAGEFQFLYWQTLVSISYPDFVARNCDTHIELSIFDQTLMAYYFLTCDGFTPTGNWISFSELPDGRFYNQAFQGYSGHRVAETFGDDIELFCKAAINLGGEEWNSWGDAHYRFQALPFVPLLTVYQLGDDDFPPSCRILYDAAVNHHLPTDVCALVGSSLARKLIKEKDSIHENCN